MTLIDCLKGVILEASWPVISADQGPIYSKSLNIVVLTDFTSLDLDFYIGTLVNKWGKPSFIIVLEYEQKRNKENLINYLCMFQKAKRYFPRYHGNGHPVYNNGLFKETEAH